MARTVETTSFPLPIRFGAQAGRWTVGLLSIGIVLYLLCVLHWFPRDRNVMQTFVLPLGGVAALGFFLTRPQWYRPLADRLDHVRYPSARRRFLNTLRIWLAASVYLGLTALRQHRDFGLRVQDEMMYLLQVRMLAAGHLYLPAHPMADFFQTFYIFTKPVYASMYFPGASLFFVPAIWLHLPMWLISLVISGAVVAMTYRVATELTDGVWGGLAALLVLALPTFRVLSLQVLSYLPMAILGLLLIGAYLHFRRERKLGWAVLIGLFAGWAAITRPLDAICFALPVGIAMLIDLRGMGFSPVRLPSRPMHGRDAHATLLILVAILCALPFLTLQLFINHGITGRWLQTPVQQYEELYWPGVAFGLHPHLLPGEHPLATSLPQFRDNYARFVLPHFTGKQRTPPRPFTQTLNWGIPQPLLIVLLPMSLLSLRVRRRWVPVVTLALFPLAYFTWVMFLPYYAVVVAPLIAFAVVLGASQLADQFPLHRKAVSTWLAASIFFLAVISLPEFGAKDSKVPSSEVMQTYNQLSKSIQKPAVVFFRYPTDDPMAWRHEQTYNIDAASIDDQFIIRAQDLGDKNIDLIQYYQTRQPERAFYLFDQKTKRLTPFPLVNRPS